MSALVPQGCAENGDCPKRKKGRNAGGNVMEVDARIRTARKTAPDARLRATYRRPWRHSLKRAAEGAERDAVHAPRVPLRSLTIGTGLGTARFTNRSTSTKN